MRLVRCDDCGAKALSAASQCPRCTRPLRLRDDRGGALPLAHCRVCDTYYLRSLGACKWCGTTAVAHSSSRRPWVLGAVMLLAVGGATLWYFLGSPWTRTAVTSPTANPTVEAANVPVDVPVDAAGPVGGVASDSASTGVPHDNSVAPRAVDSSRSDTAVLAVVPSPAGVPLAPPVGSAPLRLDTSIVRWRRGVATTWANVRADARRDAPIITTVSPEQVVQGGDVVQGWRRVRLGTVVGWVDAKLIDLGR